MLLSCDLLAHLKPVFSVLVLNFLLKVLCSICQIPLFNPVDLILLCQSLACRLKHSVFLSERTCFFLNHDHLLLELIDLSTLILVNASVRWHAELLQRVLVFLLFIIAVDIRLLDTGWVIEGAAYLDLPRPLVSSSIEPRQSSTMAPRNSCASSSRPMI